VAVAITLLGVVATPVIGIMVVTATRQRAKLAELVAELEGSRAESARLSREAGVAAERERLAREIHDTLAQGFTSIVTLAQAVDSELEADPAAATKHIELIRTTARENLAEARVMVAGLTPTALDEDSLAAAIQRQAERLSAETGIAVKVAIGEQLPALGMAADVVLLRATQEALANVRKHSRADLVRVELAAADHCVRLSLQDNGIGLSGDHYEGFGLRGMRERVAQVGGTMTVSRTPCGGVTVAVEVPT
jgi:signal transduction histidine kinase